MNLDQIVSIFERAARAESPYPTWESFDAAFAAIETNEDLHDAIVGHCLFTDLPEFKALKASYGERSFVKAVQNAKLLYPILLNYQMHQDAPAATAKNEPLKF